MWNISEKLTDTPYFFRRNRDLGTISVYMGYRDVRCLLGGSVTVGCGAAHPLQRCDALSSWTRILHDQLVAAFGGQTERVEMAVWGKSAIRANYFTWCTSAKVPATSHVVLLEVQANLWFAGQRSCPRCAASLESLVEHVRRAAPSAAIMFVGWPVRDGPHVVESIVRQVANARELRRRHAREHGVAAPG